MEKTKEELFNKVFFDVMNQEPFEMTPADRNNLTWAINYVGAKKIFNAGLAESEKTDAKNKKGRGLMKEMLIALKIYGAKYNVSLIADVEKFLNEGE